jgi:hypothetical protein
MKTQLLSLALSLGATCFLLWLRQLIIDFGKRRRVPRMNEVTHPSRPAMVGERQELRRSSRSADLVPSASPVQIEELLAELRAKSARPQGD